MTRLKVCCIANEEELALALAAGATAIGLVGPMPSGPGPIPLDRIRQLAPLVPPPVESFLLTSQTTLHGIVEEHAQALTTTLQLVDHVPHDVLAELRHARPGIRLVQVIHVSGERSIAEALRVAPLVDALLLDSGNPTAAVKELGGTGRTHDWTVSRGICERSPVPVFLAGGLHAGNVAQAIATVRPYGVDVCSGVRTDGRLDAGKLAAFAAAIAG